MTNTTQADPVLGTLTVEIELTKSLVDAIVGTFLDGCGTGYWVQSADTTFDRSGEHADLYLAEVVALGGTVDIVTAAEERDGTPIISHIDLASVLRGFTLAYTGKHGCDPGSYGAEAASEFLNDGNPDFWHADCIIQLGCFGEVVYG